MEFRRFKTLVDKTHFLGMDLFVRYEISCVMTAMLCDKNPAFGGKLTVERCDKGTIFIVDKTTDKEYEAFAQVIERKYPRLCVFDYVE